MKAVILAGGLGTRLSEETSEKPKPMVEIGGKPILWHIMKIFSYHGINEFLICCGYKSYVIKEYFKNYSFHNSNLKINLKNNSIEMKKSDDDDDVEGWTIECIDTGDNTQTGGRLKRIREHLDENGPFLFTYGDGVGNIDITKLIQSHNSSSSIATVTAVNPPGRFGTLALDASGKVLEFEEKPASGDSWINGGFFVLEKEVFDYIEGDHTAWEREPLQAICKAGKLNAYKHHGFWQPMDTLREKKMLHDMFINDVAPWKIW